jgi:AcrR family transcriptional regulator
VGTQERRERERLERKEQIVKAARRLFRRNGYARTTMPAIASAAELAPGTLYLYFPSKQALYLELLHEGYGILEGRLREAVAGAASPREQAGALLDAFLRFAREAPDTFDVIFFILQEAGREIAGMREGREVMARLAVKQDGCKAVAAGVLKRARPKLSREAVALEVDAVWSMLAGVVLHFRRDPPEVFRAVAGQARELILRGLLGIE